MDKEFLQYIKEMGYDDLLDIEEKDIPKFKDTLGYQVWQLGNATRELGSVLKKSFQETRSGSIIISIAKFLDRCIEKIF